MFILDNFSNDSYTRVFFGCGLWLLQNIYFLLKSYLHFHCHGRHYESVSANAFSTKTDSKAPKNDF